MIAKPKLNNWPTLVMTQLWRNPKCIDIKFELGNLSCEKKGH